MNKALWYAYKEMRIAFLFDATWYVEPYGTTACYAYKHAVAFVAAHHKEINQLIQLRDEA